MLMRGSLALQMVAFALLFGGTGLMIVTTLSRQVAGRAVHAEVDNRARVVAVEAARRLRTFLDRFEMAADDMAADLTHETSRSADWHDPEFLGTHFEGMLRTHHDAHAIGVVWRDPALHGPVLMVSRHAPPAMDEDFELPKGANPALSPDEFEVADQPDEMARLTGRDEPAVASMWVADARNMTAPGWLMSGRDTRPGGILTFVQPVTYVAGGSGLGTEFAALAVQLPIPRLSEILQIMSLGPGGQVFLLDDHGDYLAHRDHPQLGRPAPDLIKRQLPPGLPEAADDRQLLANVRFAELPGGAIDEDPSWMAMAPVPGLPWTIGVAESAKAHLESLERLQRQLTGIALLGALVLCLGALTMSARLSRPLRRLKLAARELSDGDLSEPLPRIAGSSEILALGQSFETMRLELRKYIDRLERETQARERTESEVRIAKTIQFSLLPRVFPTSPCFEIAADLLPARHVGGDLYDIRMLDNRTLFLAIGDVTDKGIPAALFMAVTRSFLRSIVAEERSPGRVLERLNDAVAEDNESSMFVTVFAAMVDLPTGVCRYASGGHNPPLLMPAGGAPRPLEDANGMALGVLPELTYDEGEFVLQPGDGLLLYTDGVTEACDPDGRLFGLERTAQTLAESDGQDCRSVVEQIETALGVYASGGTQTDDITVVMLRYYGQQQALREVGEAAG